MGELSYLAGELKANKDVTKVKSRGDVVGFNVNHGEYNSLSSEIVSILGRYDCELYIFPDEEYKYRLVAP